jgi:DNA-binding transcriptional regulator LsrR (DeoR family)
VLQYSSQGYSIREIAQKLQIDKSAVNRYLQFLKQQAQNNLQHHIQEVVPMEYERSMTGMKRNLKQTLEIAETAADPKVKLQARAIANDCYKYIMDLTTNGAIVTDAIKYVTQKIEQLDTLKKLDEKIETFDEEATTNGVF